MKMPLVTKKEYYVILSYVIGSEDGLPVLSICSHFIILLVIVCLAPKLFEVGYNKHKCGGLLLLAIERVCD